MFEFIANYWIVLVEGTSLGATFCTWLCTNYFGWYKEPSKINRVLLIVSVGIILLILTNHVQVMN